MNAHNTITPMNGNINRLLNTDTVETDPKVNAINGTEKISADNVVETLSLIDKKPARGKNLNFLLKYSPNKSIPNTAVNDN